MGGFQHPSKGFQLQTWWFQLQIGRFQLKIWGFHLQILRVPATDWGVLFADWGIPAADLGVLPATQWWFPVVQWFQSGGIQQLSHELVPGKKMWNVPGRQWFLIPAWPTGHSSCNCYRCAGASRKLTYVSIHHWCWTKLTIWGIAGSCRVAKRERTF